MTDLKEGMEHHHLLISRDLRDDNDDEIAQSMFNGKCNNCGIFTHMAKDFRKKKMKQRLN